MTVAELIAKLQEMPGDAEVVASGNSTEFTVETAQLYAWPGHTSQVELS